MTGRFLSLARELSERRRESVARCLAHRFLARPVTQEPGPAVGFAEPLNEGHVVVVVSAVDAITFVDGNPIAVPQTAETDVFVP